MSTGELTTLATAESSADEQSKLFELAQRQASVYAKSTLVPKEYQGNIGNVLIAQNMARRIGADLLQVMQSLYIVHGKPSWSSSFLIACMNSCGKFSRMRFEFSGQGDDYGCEAIATEVATGHELRGTKITWKMVKAEGWSTKTGSKWLTMPEQMFRYRAAAFFVRAYAPELSLGLKTAEENNDVVDAESVTDVSGTRTDALKSKLGITSVPEQNIVSETANAGEVVEVAK